MSLRACQLEKMLGDEEKHKSGVDEYSLKNGGVPSGGVKVTIRENVANCGDVPSVRWWHCAQAWSAAPDALVMRSHCEWRALKSPQKIMGDPFADTIN